MKFANAFFIGILFVLAVIFTLFVGLKTSYFDYYNVSEYFNIIFVDSVPWLVVLPVSIVFGYLLLYVKFRKYVRIFYAFIILIAAASWQEGIGRRLGEAIFMSESVNVKMSADSNVTFSANRLYTGRKATYYLRSDNGKTVQIRDSR